jgi:hypothetical protein
MIRPKIISHEPSPTPFRSEMGGGPNDGMCFDLVRVQLESGDESWAFTCNAMPGYFRQVFVPWHFGDDGFVAPTDYKEH